MNSKKYFWPFLILILIYLLAFYTVLFKSYQGKITGFFHIGQRQPVNRHYFHSLNYPATSTWGYDGQFYLGVALDPFMKTALFRSLDTPAYRYSKIAYPLAGWLLAGGQPALIPGAMILINWAGFFIGCFLFLKLLEKHRAPPWLIIIYGFLPCFATGLFWATTDSLAASLMVMAYYFLDEEKITPAWTLMTLAALTKETSLILPAAASLSYFLKRDFSKGGRCLLPAVFYAALGLFIYLKIGSWTFLGNTESLRWPLVSLYTKINALLKLPPHSGQTFNLLWIFFALLATGLSLRAVFQKRSAASLGYLLAGILVLTVSHTIWQNFLGYGRITSLVGLFGLLFFLQKKEFVHLVPPAVFAMLSVLLLWKTSATF